MGKVNKWRV